MDGRGGVPAAAGPPAGSRGGPAAAPASGGSAGYGAGLVRGASFRAAAASGSASGRRPIPERSWRSRPRHKEDASYRLSPSFNAVTTLHTVYCSRSTIIGSRIIAKLRSVGVFDLLAGNPDPVVRARFPDGECGCREIRIVECAQGNCDQPVELAVDLVMHVRPAVGA